MSPFASVEYVVEVRAAGLHVVEERRRQRRAGAEAAAVRRHGIDAVTHVAVGNPEHRKVGVAARIQKLPVGERRAAGAVVHGVRSAIKIRRACEEAIAHPALALHARGPLIALIGIGQEDRIAEGRVDARQNRPPVGTRLTGFGVIQVLIEHVLQRLGVQKLGRRRPAGDGPVVCQVPTQNLRVFVVRVEQVDLVRRCRADGFRLVVRIRDERDAVGGVERDSRSREFEPSAGVLIREPHVRRPPAEDADSAANLLRDRTARG